MTVRPLYRRQLLLICLVASLSAAAWTYWRQGRVGGVDVVGVVNSPRLVPVPKLLASQAALSPMNLQLVNRADSNDLAVTDPFPAKSWQVVLPAPAPPLPPPPLVPTAPVLPIKYLGRQEEPGNPVATVFYLSKGGNAYAVRAGDKLDDEYQFDGIEQGNMQFTYLPLSTKQTLFVGIDP